VQRTLGRTVEQHDDNTHPGMYDLRIGPVDRPEIAIECVGAVDRKFTEAWNVGCAKGPWNLSVQGDWDVGVSQTFRFRHLEKGLTDLLRELEMRGIWTARADHVLRHTDPDLYGRMQLLKVTDAFGYRTAGSGKVTFSLPGRGGAVDTCGSSVAPWLGSYLREPGQADVLAKLMQSGAPERHVFLFVEVHGAPWPVESYLFRKIVRVPSSAPDLPETVTAAWIAPTSGEHGLYWDRCNWSIIDLHPGE
jgi:hypothetical protein